MKMEVPCKGCTDRQVGCHGSCERYAKFWEWRKQRQAERRMNDVVMDYCRDNYKKRNPKKTPVVLRLEHEKKG